MNILITGAAGFVGKNLTAALECIRDGKDRTHPGLTIGELYLYDLDSPNSLLEEACQKADFVFNLAGVNRPENPEDFMKGNFGFASDLLNTLAYFLCVGGYEIEVNIINGGVWNRGVLKETSTLGIQKLKSLVKVELLGFVSNTQIYLIRLICMNLRTWKYMHDNPNV